MVLPKRKQRWPARLPHKWKSFQKKIVYLLEFFFLHSYEIAKKGTLHILLLKNGVAPTKQVLTLTNCLVIFLSTK